MIYLRFLQDPPITRECGFAAVKDRIYEVLNEGGVFVYTHADQKKSGHLCRHYIPASHEGRFFKTLSPLEALVLLAEDPSVTPSRHES